MVIMLNSYYKKNISVLTIRIDLCYMKNFIIRFSQAIRLVKSGRQFVYQIL